ncbi:MAG: pentapeptide repeat-containing protein [Cyanobacteria bacterium P01_D01_bin.14]
MLTPQLAVHPEMGSPRRRLTHRQNTGLDRRPLSDLGILGRGALPLIRTFLLSQASMDAAELVSRYQQGERTFEQVDLHERTLVGVDLSHSLMPAANFAIANLSSANLSHCSLNQADFNVARLSGANLSDAQLVRARLNVANLVRAILTGANLTASTLVRVEAMRCELSHALLRQADLTEADLQESQLRWSDLTEANLSRVNLSHSSLTGTCLRQTQLNAADLTQVDLRGAVLEQANLQSAQLAQADLAGANLQGACLRWANLRGANLSDADLTGAKLSGANLRGANLSGADLSETSFIQANLSHANLMHTQWRQADLTEAQLTGAKLYGSTRFDLATRALQCDWVDLSADGRGKDLCYFQQADEIHTFFNRSQPSVELLIDAPLSTEAHAMLAQRYAQLTQQPDSMLQTPPSIHVDVRKTQLLFHPQQDRTLFSLAQAAILPFISSQLLQRHLVMMTSRLQAFDLAEFAPPQRQQLSVLIYGLVDLCHRCARQARLPGRQPVLESSFFTQPIQIRLTNSSGQCLMLYRSPRFGVRCPADLAPSLPQATALSPAPSLEALVNFLLGSRVEAVMLRQRSPTGSRADRSLSACRR